MAVTIVRDKSFVEHDTGPEHPETSERLRAIDRALEGVTFALRELEARPATEQEILSVHSEEHFEKLLAHKGVAHSFDPDTHASEGSVNASLRAAGSAVELATRVFNKEVPPGIALVRPPGHHATRDQAMGFCLVNNVAVAAEALRKAGLAERIAIYDCDVHHGNGTQDIFHQDPNVLFMSTHQWPLYPGTGRADDRGRGKGEGATVNIPLPAGVGDEVILKATEEVFVPRVRKFKPDMILISAGFDAYMHDPVGGMKVSVEGFGALFARWGDLSAELCDGRIAGVLEGGYNLDGLGACVRSALQAWVD